jgi:cardiolipin synthase A/B
MHVMLPLTPRPVVRDEQIVTEGDAYFERVTQLIDEALEEVIIEAYIFSFDAVGKKISEALNRATERNVSVRILVDGFGSLGWSSRASQFLSPQIQWKVFNPTLFDVFVSKSVRTKGPLRRASTTSQSRLGKYLRFVSTPISRFNKRNHRKLAIIDKERVLLGSRNICESHSEQCSGRSCWKDISIEIFGEEVALFHESFEHIWRAHPYRPPQRPSSALLSLMKLYPRVRLNLTRKIRTRNYRSLLSLIDNAESRILIVAAYFIPPPRLITALQKAARRGVRIEVVVSSRSDVMFIPWVVHIIQETLERVGVIFYWYELSNIHAKILYIDDRIILGSSNFNHRSVIHDLEVDIELQSDLSKKQVEDFYREVCSKSTQKDIHASPWATKILGYFFYKMKSWL